MNESDAMPPGAAMPDDAAVVAATRRWLERAVIGLNLCPFAKGVHSKQQIHYVVCRANRAEEVLAVLEAELLALAALPAQQRDTSLLMLPDGMADFLDFNDFLDECESLLSSLGLAGVLQIASFHPQFRFAGTAEDDVGNDTFPYMSCRDLHIGWAPVMAARITYMGELGWEIYVAPEYAVHVYERLWQAGTDVGIVNAGYKAISSLRMEKRYLYWGADITPDDTPLEAGLGFAVAWKKSNFLGRDALLAQKERGIGRKLMQFRLDDPLPVYGSEAVISQGRVIGMTTSGDVGHTIGAPIVFAYLEGDDMNLTEVEIEAFGKRSGATVIKGCAYDPGGDRIRA